MHLNPKAVEYERGGYRRRLHPNAVGPNMDRIRLSAGAPPPRLPTQVRTTTPVHTRRLQTHSLGSAGPSTCRELPRACGQAGPRHRSRGCPCRHSTRLQIMHTWNYAWVGGGALHPATLDLNHTSHGWPQSAADVVAIGCGCVPPQFQSTTGGFNQVSSPTLILGCTCARTHAAPVAIFLLRWKCTRLQQHSAINHTCHRLHFPSSAACHRPPTPLATQALGRHVHSTARALDRTRHRPQQRPWPQAPSTTKCHRPPTPLTTSAAIGHCPRPQVPRPRTPATTKLHRPHTPSTTPTVTAPALGHTWCRLQLHSAAIARTRNFTIKCNWP